MDLTQLVHDIVTHLTGEPSDVILVEDEFGAVITIIVSGKVSSLMGKGGSTIAALRTLLKALGCNSKHRIKLKVQEHVAKIA